MAYSEPPQRIDTRPIDYDRVRARLKSRRWRMRHLYRILDADGHDVRFEPNPVQIELDRNLHFRNLVPKSRQHGITTWACIRALDTALFRAGSQSGIIAHNLADAQRFFRGKILYAYDRLPAWLRDAIPLVKRDMTGIAEFANGSTINVGTSLRSGTLNYLHISEYGPMCALQPAKALEVRAGALNTVAPGSIVTVESTMYGVTGDFADRVRAAEALELEIAAGRAVLTEMDYRLHFFPWWRDARNVTPATGIVLDHALMAYFAAVEAKCNTVLAPEQRAWYRGKALEQGDMMHQEHPSTLAEAFQASIQGAYYVHEMSAVRATGRIKRDIPITRGVPVDTFWDIGWNDTTAIWLHQYVTMEHRMLAAYQASERPLEHYVDYLRGWIKDRNVVFGTHYLPHDAAHKSLRAGKSTLDYLRQLMPGQTFEVVPRIERVLTGITALRSMFGSIWFDEVGCADGVAALDKYRKKWNTATQSYADEPVHDDSSNFADAIRQMAQGWRIVGLRNTAAREVVGRQRMA